MSNQKMFDLAAKMMEMAAELSQEVNKLQAAAPTAQTHYDIDCALGLVSGIIEKAKKGNSQFLAEMVEHKSVNVVGCNHKGLMFDDKSYTLTKRDVVEVLNDSPAVRKFILQQIAEVDVSAIQWRLTPSKFKTKLLEACAGTVNIKKETAWSITLPKA